MKNIFMIVSLLLVVFAISYSAFAQEATPAASTDEVTSTAPSEAKAEKPAKKSKKVKPKKTEETEEVAAEEAEEELLTPEAKVTLGLTYGVTNFFTAWISALIVMIGGAGARCLFGTIGDVVVWIIQFGMIGGLIFVTPNPDATVYTLGVFGAILGAGLGIFQGWFKTVTVA